MKIDKNYFEKLESISSFDRVDSVPVYGGDGTLKHYILGLGFYSFSASFPFFPL